MFDIPFGNEPDIEDEVGPYSTIPFLPIYLDDNETFVVVDVEDYMWASQWRWQPKYSKNKRKVYACRALTLPSGKRVSIYLHKEILFRAHGLPPGPAYIIGDHCDGNSQNDRRHNLRWATPKMNRQNYNGVYAMQIRMCFKTGGVERLEYSHTYRGKQCLVGQRAASPQKQTASSVRIEKPSTATRSVTTRTSPHSGAPF